MGLILSVDLAYKSYEDFGFCLLEESDGKVVNLEFMPNSTFNLSDTPQVEVFVSNVLDFCLSKDISILMLDGPQGWKDPRNGLPHQRVCEKILNTQAKTGIKGIVKPANFTSFVSFAIDIFHLFNNSGQISLVMKPEIDLPIDKILLVETYPYSAWRSLNFRRLPGKKKCSTQQILLNYEVLRKRFSLPRDRSPSHDELSALVAGLAGVAIVASNKSEYIASGIPPELAFGGYLMEGYIVNPFGQIER